MSKKLFLIPILFLILLASFGCKHYFTQTGESNDGYLRFEVEPPDAKVFVDGIYVGKAKDFSEKDLRKKEKFLKVSSGTHTLRFEHDKYKAAVRDVYAGHGIETINLRLEPL